MIAGPWYHSSSDAYQSTTAMSQSSPCQPPQNRSYTLPSSSTSAPRTSRPKLTLQTACVPRTFGKSNTALSLPFVSDPTASPTVRNTFKNAYNVAFPSAPSSPSITSNNKPCKPSSRPAYNSVNTNTNNNGNNPYQLPRGLKSILLNSPLEAPARRRYSSMSLAPSNPNGGSSASRRVFFPVRKQVKYRYPLEEEIRTVRFTARHSDLEDEPESEPCGHGDGVSDEYGDSDVSSTPSHSDTSTSDDDSVGVSSPAASEMKKKRRHPASEKQIHVVALRGSLDGKSTSAMPPTPQSRTKRRREWRWTLGSLDTNNDTNHHLLSDPLQHPSLQLHPQ